MYLAADFQKRPVIVQNVLEDCECPDGVEYVLSTARATDASLIYGRGIFSENFIALFIPPENITVNADKVPCFWFIAQYNIPMYSKKNTGVPSRDNPCISIVKNGDSAC